MLHQLGGRKNRWLRLGRLRCRRSGCFIDDSSLLGRLPDTWDNIRMTPDTDWGQPTIPVDKSSMWDNGMGAVRMGMGRMWPLMGTNMWDPLERGP